ncbi:alpha-galactosidase, partial [bacterium]
MFSLLGVVALQAKTYDISALDLTLMRNGWNRPVVGRSIEGKPLTLKGQRYERGLGTHANARLNLRLDRATAFDATVGVDDETKGRGTVEFLIVVDGKERWRSG